MGWLNFDNKPKFYISLGLILLFFMLIFMIGSFWVIDEQVYKIIDTNLRIMELGDDAKEPYLKVITNLLIGRTDALIQFNVISSILMGGFFITGFGLLIKGIHSWGGK